MSYQRIYPNLDDDDDDNDNEYVLKQLNLSNRFKQGDETEMLRERIKVLKQYVEQANTIIEDLKRRNARLRTLVRKRQQETPPNLLKELLMGCLIATFLVSIIKIIEIHI